MRSHTPSSILAVSVTTLLALVMLETNTPAYAASPADASSVTCDSLTVSPSDDQNSYVLKAAASGPANVITGYIFDYGDRESYSVAFGSKAGTDHRSATVTHTYKKPGTYIVAVRVTVKTHSKSTDVSSNACKTSVTVLPPGTLPNTGVNIYAAATAVSITAAFIAALCHSIWLRRSKTGSTRSS